jgi:hypothetical protein
MKCVCRRTFYIHCARLPGPIRIDSLRYLFHFFIKLYVIIIYSDLNIYHLLKFLFVHFCFALFSSGMLFLARFITGNVASFS